MCISQVHSGKLIRLCIRLPRLQRPESGVQKMILMSLTLGTDSILVWYCFSLIRNIQSDLLLFPSPICRLNFPISRLSSLTSMEHYVSVVSPLSFVLNSRSRAIGLGDRDVQCSAPLDISTRRKAIPEPNSDPTWLHRVDTSNGTSHNAVLGSSRSRLRAPRSRPEG